MTNYIRRADENILKRQFPILYIVERVPWLYFFVTNAEHNRNVITIFYRSTPRKIPITAKDAVSIANKTCAEVSRFFFCRRPKTFDNDNI